MFDFECGMIEALPSRYNDEGELGVFPAIAAAIPMVANLAGSLLGKKSSKGGGPPPEAGTAQNVLDVLTKAIGGDQSEGSIKEVVKNIVATVPSPVLKTVQQAIRDMKNQDAAKIAARDLIVHKVDAKFGPQIHALLAAMKAAQLQKQATYEHTRLKEKAKFRSQTAASLNAINRRLSVIEARLTNSAIVQGRERIQVLGGRAVLEK